MNRLYRRLTASLGTILFLLFMSIGTAHANPARITVSVAFKPWYTNVTQALGDVIVGMQVNPIPGKVPIQQSPYNGNHLSPGGGFPQQNIYLYDNSWGFANNIPNEFLAPAGSTTRMTSFANFAWCGVPLNGLVPGEFTMQYKVAPKAGATFTSNGGRWVAYWHWMTNGAVDIQSAWSIGDTVNAPANNDQETQVFFVYEENPPLFNVIGGKYDRYGNANNAPWTNGIVRDNNVGDTSSAQPYNLGSRNQAQDHIISADPLADWTATGWRLQNNNSTGNGNSYGFPANSVPKNTTQVLDFFYEPRPSTIQQGFLIKDPSNGQIKNPCGLSGYLSQPCSNQTQATISRNFNLPNGLVNPFTTSPQTVSPTSPGADGGVVGVSGLYTGSYTSTLNTSSMPAGWRVAGVIQCNENADYKSCYSTAAVGGPANSFGINISANRSRPVYFVLEPASVNLRGTKRGPGTFVNQNSDTTDVTNGSAVLNGATISASGQTGYSAQLRYNPSSPNNTFTVTADQGWLIRGYSLCTGSPAAPNCHNDGTTTGAGAIDLSANNQSQLTLTINYGSATPTLNGVSLGSDVWINVYLKPRPIDVQARAYIDQKGGDGQKINPCDSKYAGNYKQNICQSDVRAIRMNTANNGGYNYNSDAYQDLGDPAGQYGNCTSTDYIPTKVGYGYNNFGNYYCAKNDAGGVTQAGGTATVKYGWTWDALGSGGGRSQNQSSSENNAAIFRNLYPGKYSFETVNGPSTANISGSLVSTPGPGVSSNPELAYSVAQSTCDVNTTQCQQVKPVINDSGGCELNHRRKADYAYFQNTWFGGYWQSVIGQFGNPTSTVESNGERYCTIMWSGPPQNESAPSFGSPDQWNPSINWNAARPSACRADYYLGWNPGRGSIGTGVIAGTNCGYPKWATLSSYTYSMGVQPGVNSSGGKQYREQNFIYTPKVKVTDAVLSCGNYTARVAYMPDPSRKVTSYFTFANVPLTDGSGSLITVDNYQSGAADNYTINLTIPKYNGNGQLLKDGLQRGFNHFGRFPDADLQSGYTQGQKDVQTPTALFSPTVVYSGTHICQNNATCNISNAPASIDSDEDSPYTVTVDVQNTGSSYWMQNVTENDQYGIQRKTNTTNHGLMSAPGTQLGQPSGWEISGLPSGSAGYSAWLVLGYNDTPPPSIQVFPQSVDVTKSSYQYQVKVTAPKDGGKQFRLGFQMAQNGVQFGSPCEVQIDVVNSYKPWLRVQNGNTSALGKAYNQADGAKGTYKSNKVPQDPPSSGIPPEPTSLNNNDINLQAAYVVYGAVTGDTGNPPANNSNRFCSANAYNLGRTTAGAYNYKTDGCSLGVYRFRLPSDVAQNLQADSSSNSTDKLYESALNSFNTKGGCDDTNSNTPDEVPSAAKMYRQGNNGVPLTGSNFAELPRMGGPGQGAISLVTVENSGNSPVKKPCPTIYRWDAGPTGVLSDPSGTLKIGAGRATVIVDTVKNGPGKLTINSNILNQIGALSFQLNSGGYATASMNQLPNLGIIVKGDVVIDKSVTEINASIYATGTISTCDKYDNGLDDTTTGTAAPRKNKITLNNQPKLPPYEDNADAKQCSNKLVVKGSLVAGDGFKFGRNYIDFIGMSNRMNALTVPSNWGPQAPFFDNYAGYPEYNLFRWPGDPSRNKFCSTDPGYRCKADHWGAFHDFDAPGFINRVTNLSNPSFNSGNPYRVLNYTGYPQAGYTSDPAEDITGNGLSLMFAPPGFDNLGSDDFINAKFVDNSSSPKF